MKKIIPFLIIALMAVACKKEQQAEPVKTLVLYYSQTGVTEQVAEQIQSLTDADIACIELEEPYDGTYEQTIARVIEERENGVLPTLKPLTINVENYDIIYLGYPIWFGTYAPPIAALVKEQSFENKTIIPFCTFGSGGLESSMNDLKEALPNATVCAGYGCRTARIAQMPAELNYFMKANGYLEGEVEALPDFSEQAEVSQNEVDIFNAACADYKYPLGTPVRFALRELNDCIEYQFVANSQKSDGTPVEAIIYIIVKENEKPEFTKVVR